LTSRRRSVLVYRYRGAVQHAQRSLHGVIHPLSSTTASPFSSVTAERVTVCASGIGTKSSMNTRTSVYHASASVAAALRVPLEDVEREWQPMLDAGMIVYHDGRYRTKGAA